MTQRVLRNLTQGGRPMAMNHNGLGAAELESQLWFPAPAHSSEQRRPACATAPSLSQAMVAATRKGFAEEAFMGFLAGASAIAIGYGFLSLLDSLDRWGVFQNYVARLLQ